MDLPFILVSNNKNEIFEVPGIYMVGIDSLRNPRLPGESELIQAPEGITPMILPGRRAVGYDAENKCMKTITRYQGEEVWAVGGFLPPAYTMTLRAAYDREEHSPPLPLFAYSSLGWKDGFFISSGVRVDPDVRQDVNRFSEQRIRQCVPVMRKKYKNNRLARHLLEKCCLTYCCPAARNWVLNRWEAPLPTTPSCNARCIGCISLQEDKYVPATQNRLDFIPTVNEIVDLGVDHLKTASKPVISFGQGCEGEPLLNAGLIAEAIASIRVQTGLGTININSNGFSPSSIKKLCQAGCDSFRISINSVQKKYYERYFSPVNYCFEDVLESLKVIKSYNKWCSVNYFIFPGFTDTEQEMMTLENLLAAVPIDMIQMRNLNIDPEWYINRVLYDVRAGEGKGILEWMTFIKSRFPTIRFGYFNPYLVEKEADTHGE